MALLPLLKYRNRRFKFPGEAVSFALASNSNWKAHPPRTLVIPRLAAPSATL